MARISKVVELRPEGVGARRVWGGAAGWEEFK